jgi:hypothetical protein
MKTLKFLGLFILFSINCLAGYFAWDYNTVEVIEWENNRNGLLGNYNLEAKNGGNGYDNVLFKSGLYSGKVTVFNNSAKFPDTLVNYLGIQSKWTIEGWHYVTSTLSPNFWQPALVRGWSSGTNGMQFAFTNNGYSIWYSGTPGGGASATVIQNDWNFWSLQWTGTRIQLYINQVLLFDIPTTKNIFDSLTYDTLIGSGDIYPDTYNSISRFDKIIISNTTRNGIETMPTYIDGVQIFRKADMYYYRK